MKVAAHPRNAAQGRDGIRNAARTLKTIAAAAVRMVLVETRRFGQTSLAIIGLTLAIILLLVGGWLIAGAATVMALARLEAFGQTGALLTVALAHLVLALIAWRLSCMTRSVTFRETR